MNKRMAWCVLIVFVCACCLALFAACVDGECKHAYSDGVCYKCGEPCNHQFEDGKCKICGIADPTPVVCEHSFVKGVCVKCGEPDPDFTQLYYRNPILQVDCADPHIIRHDGVFYIFSTGLKIFKSTDTVTWESAGTMGINPTWGTKGAGNWAPDVVKIGNKFLVYYSRSSWGDANPGIGVASADHPLGPWTDHGCMFLSKDIGVENSIDAGVFVGQDGKVYMTWGSFRGIYCVQLTDDGLNLYNGIDYARENKVLIAGKVGEWDGTTFEGAYVIFKDGYYYFFGSSGTCCDGLNSTYNVRVGRSRNPMGPYVDSNGVDLANNRNVGHQVVQGSSMLVGPGHNSIFVDDAGDYWMVYHLYQNDNGNARGRYLAIDKLIWDADGWCSVKSLMPSSKKTEAPYIASSK